jgi:hypothetical protein
MGEGLDEGADGYGGFAMGAAGGRRGGIGVGPRGETEPGADAPPAPSRAGAWPTMRGPDGATAGDSPSPNAPGGGGPRMVRSLGGASHSSSSPKRGRAGGVVLVG